MNINKRFPSIADMERAAQQRMPKFAHDYLVGGLGEEACVRRNLDAMQSVLLLPRYITDAQHPEIGCEFLGRKYAAPFGIAPLGLAGLLWPNAERLLARAANRHNVPFALSTFANASLEQIRPITPTAWFQYYPPSDPAVAQDLLTRAQIAGYETIVVTVDIPVATKRERDARNGITVPPAFYDLRTLWQMVSHPTWALGMLRAGVPEFVNLKPYFPAGGSIEASVRFIAEVMKGHISAEIFRQIRAFGPGKILVKGILSVSDAQGYLDLGADGLIISNHGGRQFDAAPSAVTVLPQIRAAVGSAVPLVADGGVRSGLDIGRYLALGANFVLVGRPFIYGLAALDKRGPDHTIHLLKSELRTAMAQLGCQTLAQLPDFRFAPA